MTDKDFLRLKHQLLCDARDVDGGEDYGPATRIYAAIDYITELTRQRDGLLAACKEGARHTTSFFLRNTMMAAIEAAKEKKP